MLSNRLIRGPVPQMTRDPINVDNDDLHHKAIQASQRKNDKGKDTQKDPPIFIPGIIVAIQQEDRGLWKHYMIIEPNNHDQGGHSFTICVTKIGRLIIQNSKHISSTNITSEEHLH